MEGEQNVRIISRRRIEMSGVVEVSAFSETEVAAVTTLGEVSVGGSGLKIESFSAEKGELYINGEIDGMYWYDKGTGEKKRGFFGRLFG